MLPRDLGIIDLYPDEMMFWLYCPISVPGNTDVTLPTNLSQFHPIVTEVLRDNPDRWLHHYIYITAKTLWVSGDYIGNRPGWHSDGFGTGDINYIWCDRAPTEFIDVNGGFELSHDCADAMREMTEQAMHVPITTYPDRHLLRLDQRVIHRSPVGFAAGMRTFVKVSVSQDRYDLVGNSVNHQLCLNWPMVERKLDRNHPASGRN